MMIARYFFFTIFISFASICLLMSCDDEVSIKPGALPPYTDTGANLISCYVNYIPRIFVHQIGNATYSNAKFWLNYGIGKTDTVFHMYAFLYTDTNVQVISFDLLNIVDTGKYIISKPSKDFFHSITYEVGKDFNSSMQYMTTKDFTCEFYVKKLDTVNKIIAGTFNGRLKIWEYGPEFLTISNGQFDFKYEKY